MKKAAVIMGSDSDFPVVEKAIKVLKDYDIPYEKGLIGDFKRGKKKFLEVPDMLCGYVIPFDQIAFIAITDVKKDV